MLKKTDLAKLREALEEQLKRLQVDSRLDLQTKEAEHAADVNDQATQDSERNFELRLKDRNRKLINKVRESLQSMEDGEYGVCESCGEDIGVKRLMARPVTTYCINCKAELEEEEKREETLQKRMESSSAFPS